MFSALSNDTLGNAQYIQPNGGMNDELKGIGKEGGLTEVQTQPRKAKKRFRQESL
jgi:hypothetical protein